MSLFGDNCQPGLCGCNDPDPEPRVIIPLNYADRCQRYARQRGWAYDPKRMSIQHLTPRQRRRAMHKERQQAPGYSHREIDMPWDPRYGAYNEGDD